MLNKGSTVGAISCGDGIKIKDNYTFKINLYCFDKLFNSGFVK